MRYHKKGTLKLHAKGRLVEISEKYNKLKELDKIG
jgi:hypothetical protein